MKLFVLSILIGITILTIAFDAQKCEHAFTQVEQESIKIERAGSMELAFYSVPTGVHEGKELICVKCFHRQKQMVDYGSWPTLGMPTYSMGSLSLDTAK
jgi:hypothetical protein